MAKILDEVMKGLPKDAEISEAVFEGANIVLYTKNKEFLLDNQGIIRSIVDTLKKRIELRADPSTLMDIEDTKEAIKKILPEEAGQPELIFDPQRARLIIDSEKPGLAIGKGGDLLKEIKRQTLWTPIVRRIPPIRSQLIENIRQVLYDFSDYRKKFLNKVGKRIYEGWTRTKRDEWVRITALGSAREVGRSCFLLSTPESRIMLDCGYNVAAPRDYAFPYLDVPEFNINDLDAVILSHAHIDHCLPPNTLIELENGEFKPIDQIEEGEKLVTINWNNGKKEIGKCLKKIKTYTHKEIIKIKTPYANIEASPNHKFFVIDNMEVKEIEAGSLKEGMIIPYTSGESNNFNSIKLFTDVDYKERVDLPNEARLYLKSLRIEQNISQVALCKILNRGRNRIYLIENKNKSIYLDMLRQVLDFYKIDENEFYKKFNINKTLLPSALNYELAQCLGYLAGDGHISTENSLRATDQSISCLQVYSNLFNKTFNYKPEIVHHPDKTKNAFVIEVSNAGIKRYLEKNFNSLLIDSPLRELPETITLASNEIIRGFIRGFTDADGCVKDNCICLDSTSLKMLEKLHFMLNRFGIRCSISEEKVTNSYRIQIHAAESIRLFAKLIGVNHPDKIIKLNNLLQNIKDIKQEQDLFLPFSNKNIRSIIKSIGLGNGINNGLDNLSRNIFSLYAGYTSYLTRNCANDLDKFLDNRLKIIDDTIINTNIKSKRIIAGLSKEKLSKLVSLSINDISKAEKNNKDKNHDLLFNKLNVLLNDIKNNVEINLKN